MLVRTRPEVYGALAELGSPQALVDALAKVKEAGYRDIDAYTPFPIEEVCHMIKPGPTKMPRIVLAGGILGGIAGYVLQYYTAVHDYPLNIGGRPLHSWPMFIPITFELTILGAGLFAVLGMFWVNNLPMPYHPVFNAPRFALASRERYFLSIQATDPMFSPEGTVTFLRGLTPYEVTLVEP